jgi:hypothetical protein
LKFQTANWPWHLFNLKKYLTLIVNFMWSTRRALSSPTSWIRHWSLPSYIKCILAKKRIAIFMFILPYDLHNRDLINLFCTHTLKMMNIATMVRIFIRIGAIPMLVGNNRDKW